MLSMFLGSLIGAYAYAFYLGSVWVEREYWNDTFGRSYTSGDVLSIFFGIVFGFFSIGMATPNIKSVAEGRAAGKMAFEIIDRKPAID